jgi:nicotinamide-nucleotide adenylyltransferase
MSVQIAPHMLRHYQQISRALEGLDPKARPWAIVSPGSTAPRGDTIVFPGSFNPPTLALVAMLRQARKLRGARWHVYAALSKQIVDKETVERMTLLDRVVVLEQVLKNHVRDAGVLLLNRGLYVEQAQGIRAAFPQVGQLRFLVGFDKIVQILDPHYYTDRDAALNDLFALAQLLVAPRGTDGENELKELLARPENRQFAGFIYPLPLEEKFRAMASTRARTEGQLDEVPEEAREFILRTRPYAPPLRLDDGTERDLYAERTRELQELLNC